MEQCRGAERQVGASTRQLPLSDAVQFAVQHREQLFGGGAVAAVGTGDQRGELRGGELVDACAPVREREGTGLKLRRRRDTRESERGQPNVTYWHLADDCAVLCLALGKHAENNRDPSPNQW